MVLAIGQVRVKVHRGRLNASIAAQADRYVSDLLEHTTSLAKAGAPKRYGILINQTRWKITIRQPTRLGGVVGSYTDYAYWVNTGTGIYGPRGVPIRPRRAQVLRFQGRSGIVYARSVKGMRARPYLVAALRAAMAGVPSARVTVY